MTGQKCLRSGTITNEIYGRFVSFQDKPGGKIRPVLVIDSADGVVSFLRITTKFANKSEYFQKHYWKINDLKTAGLSRESYIDTTKVYKMPTVTFHDGAKFFGRLSYSDVRSFTEFIRPLN